MKSVDQFDFSSYHKEPQESLKHCHFRRVDILFEAVCLDPSKDLIHQGILTKPTHLQFNHFINGNGKYNALDDDICINIVGIYIPLIY